MRTMLLIIILFLLQSCDEEVTQPDTTPTERVTYPIGTAFVTVKDPARNNRPLPLKIYFPDSSTALHPVIFFSHGGQGSEASNEAYQYFGEWMATNGYVCIHPTQERTTAPLTEDKPKDFTFLINLLQNNQLPVDGFEGTMDKNNMGAAGHSFGAYTMMALAGAKMNKAGEIVTYTDARIKAFVALSPSGEDQFGLYYNSPTDNSWDNIRKPMYVMVGANEVNGEGDGTFVQTDWRLQPFQNMPTGDKYQSVIPGAEHYHFNDRGANGAGEPAEAYTQQFVKKNAVRFFDYYLQNKGNQAAIQNADTLQGVQQLRK